jgi:hypothetical protein
MSTDLFFEKNEPDRSDDRAVDGGRKSRADLPSAQAINPIATDPG